MEKSIEALEKMGDEASVELIDLRSIVPWDRDGDRGIGPQDRPPHRRAGGHARIAASAR